MDTKKTNKRIATHGALAAVLRNASAEAERPLTDEAGTVSTEPESSAARKPTPSPLAPIPTKGASSTPVHADTDVVSIYKLDPAKCRMWKYFNRTEEASFGDLQSLARSMKDNGQEQPVLVRPAPPNNDGIEYEIIFGHRRFRAASFAELKLDAIIKPLTDAEAFLAQAAENEDRESLSDYEIAMSYNKAITDRVLSRDRLCSQLNIAQSSLSDILSYTRIPDRVWAEIKDRTCVSRTMASRMAGYAADPNKLDALVEAARKIGDGGLSIRQLQKFMESPSVTTGADEAKVNRVIENRHGVKYFTFKWDQNESPCISFREAARQNIRDIDDFCKYLQAYLDKLEPEDEA